MEVVAMMGLVMSVMIIPCTFSDPSVASMSMSNTGMVPITNNGEETASVARTDAAWPATPSSEAPGACAGLCGWFEGCGDDCEFDETKPCHGGAGVKSFLCKAKPTPAPTPPPCDGVCGWFEGCTDDCHFDNAQPCDGPPGVKSFVCTRNNATYALDQIKILDTKLSTLFNAGNFEGMAAMYAESALLVPPSMPADSFIPQSGVADFFAEAAHAGIHDLKLSPITVVPSGATVHHEIGNATSASHPAGQLYYVRWERSDADGEWMIMTDIMAVGAPWSQNDTHARSAQAVALKPIVFPRRPFDVHAGQLDGTPTEGLIAQLDAAWGALFNNHDYNGVQRLYTPSALLLPPDDVSFVTENLLPTFLAQFDGGQRSKVTLKPTTVHSENDFVAHEIGQVTSNVGGATYYTRWEKLGMDQPWMIATNIMSIGLK